MPITRAQLLALSSPIPPARIESWLQEVASSSKSGSRRRLVAISPNVQARNSKSRKSKVPPVAEADKRGTKRKSTRDNDQEYTPENGGGRAMNAPLQKRGPGRPPKVKSQVGPVLRPTSQIDAQTSSSGSHAKRPSNKSPSRKGAKYIDQPMSMASVDMKTLETCSPGVKLMTDTDARQQYHIPREVKDLGRRVASIPPGVIPRALQSSYITSADTPRQSKISPEDFDYQNPSQECPYPEGNLSAMQVRVDQVFEDTAFNHKFKAHEGQWGVTIQRLLGELENGVHGQRFRTLNIEKCSIEPEEIRPILPNGCTMNTTATEGQPSCRTTTEDGESVRKIVDYGLTILLTMEERYLITAGFATLRPNERSLNQSLGFISHCPLFLNVESKKTQSNRDPEVQLAIWAIAGLRKLWYHGWSTHMPMPAVAINGHQWDCYIFFEANKHLIMLGPYLMGTTSSITGIWRILYYLNVLIEWGRNDYKKWFEENVLRYLQDRVAQSQSGLANGGAIGVVNG